MNLTTALNAQRQSSCIELKEVKDELKRKGTEMNQQHKEMTDKINELKTEQQQEQIKTNQQLTQMNEKMDKLMKGIAEQQTERVENAAMKIELNEAKTHQQKQHLSFLTIKRTT